MGRNRRQRLNEMRGEEQRQRIQRNELTVYRIGGYDARLHPGCKPGFEADRRAGLIYGPYKVRDPQTGRLRWAQNAEEASMIDHFCAYCGEKE